MLVVASNPLHKRCLASSLLRKRWRQGGGGGRLSDDSSTRISGVPTPLPDPPWKQEKSRTRSWKDSTTRAEKEGKHEGKVISHTPYTLLRRVGGFRCSVLWHGFELLTGYFDEPLPPKGRPRPPATFHRRIFPHLPSRPISFLDSPFWDVSKPSPSPKSPNPPIQNHPISPSSLPRAPRTLLIDSASPS